MTFLNVNAGIECEQPLPHGRFHIILIFKCIQQKLREIIIYNIILKDTNKNKCFGGFIAETNKLLNRVASAQCLVY